MTKETLTLFGNNNTTIREVNPYEGMSTGDFDQIAYRHFGFDFWINNDGDCASDKEHDTTLAYYFNLWNDTLKFCSKTGTKPCFKTFMGEVTQGNFSGPRGIV